MPNYDIIPLATDLLDYTIQRVKVKEPQYTKVKAYVMENGQMVEKELFEKIKDDGKPHFPKSQTFHMCADMQRMASAILQKCNSADGRYMPPSSARASRPWMMSPPTCVTLLPSCWRRAPMRELRLRLALFLLRKEVQDMAIVYATLIIKGRKTIDQVPALLRKQVEEILADLEVEV